MPRYRTISMWRHETTFRYIRPPEEVDLNEEKAKRLIDAGCLDPTPLEDEEPSRSEGEAGSGDGGSTFGDQAATIVSMSVKDATQALDQVGDRGVIELVIETEEAAESPRSTLIAAATKRLKELAGQE